MQRCHGPPLWRLLRFALCPAVDALLRHSATIRIAPIAGPPERESKRFPDTCSCDYCVSAYRAEPTFESKMKCIPEFDMDPARLCEVHPELNVLEQEKTDFIEMLSYNIFCLCHCQAVDLKLSQQCVIAHEVHLTTADDKGTINCNDPRLGTFSDYFERSTTEAPKELVDPPAAFPASPEELASFDAIRASHREAQRQAEAVAVASSNARLLVQAMAD